ncbi:RNA polymerase sigma factor [Paenibacillus sp. 11B]|uniref:RNA polymerase sigma factor n=1 Tax=unclassified Paenibacillus TaxID=185978 RepID=UPI001C4DDEF4|nr:RNA polymerase sigma factor [Paenibacillus sp. 11B]MDN8591575.1 RNA polymerase sigma factor [Paenibacillus sp. 11B]
MNKTAIHNAYVNYKSEVTRYLSQIVKNQQDAEDLTQECFIRMMNVTADIPEERLLYYLKRIARNLAMDTFRKRTRTLKRDSKLEMQTYHCDASELEISEGVNDLVSIINNTEHRKILELRVIHGYSIKETAQLVNRSEGMIKSSVFHAVNRIRAKVIS